MPVRPFRHHVIGVKLESKLTIHDPSMPSKQLFDSQREEYIRASTAKQTTVA
jgi:hypothetical protein